MRTATLWMVGHAARQGGFAARFDPRDGRRYAESELSATQILVAPNGTAAVGLVWLEAWQATRDPLYRDAALAAARAVADAQLASGGWGELADLGDDPPYQTRRRQFLSLPRGPRTDLSRLDRDITTEALRLVLRAGLLTDDAGLRQAVEYALRALLNAQLANGGWPTALPVPDDDRRFAHLAGSTCELIDVLAEVAPLHPLVRRAVLRGGDFLIQSRLTQPSAWATAYDTACQPLSGAPAAADATASAVRALLRLHELTGERRFLDAVAPTLPYVAQQPATTELVARVRARLRHPGLPLRGYSREELARRTAARAQAVVNAVTGLDGDGRWLDDGQVLTWRFVEQIGLLATYLREYEPLPEWSGPGDGRPLQHRR